MARWHAPLDTQHRLTVEADRVAIRPSLVRIAIIRAILLLFSGGLVFAILYNVRAGVAVFEGIILGIAGLFALLMLVGAFLPWRTITAEIDQTGIQLGGRGASVQGQIPWSRVTHILRDRQVRTTGDAEGGSTRSETWNVGLAMDDGTVVGLLCVQHRGRATALVTALERLGGVDRRARPVVPVPPAVSKADGWPPAAPHGFPHHPNVTVTERPEGVTIGPVVSPAAAARRYLGLGLAAGGAGVGVAFAVLHLYGLRWPHVESEGLSPELWWGLGHIALTLLALLGLWAAWEFLRAAWQLRSGPHHHLVTPTALIVLDRDQQVRQRYELEDVLGLQAGGGTLYFSMVGGKNERLHFEGLQRDDLYWALRAMEHALGVQGWVPAEPRQDRARFDAEHGWRPSFRPNGRSRGE